MLGDRSSNENCNSVSLLKGIAKIRKLTQLSYHELNDQDRVGSGESEFAANAEVNDLSAMFDHDKPFENAECIRCNAYQMLSDIFATIIILYLVSISVLS